MMVVSPFSVVSQHHLLASSANEFWDAGSQAAPYFAGGMLFGGGSEILRDKLEECAEQFETYDSDNAPN